MTGVLKSGSAALADRVRPLVSAPMPTAARVDLERERLAKQVEALSAELAGRDEANAKLTREAQSAFRKGEEKGRAAGRREADDHRAEALLKIEEAAERAHARLAEEMQGMERLAALIAQTCLDRLLIGSTDRTGIVCDLIAAQVAMLHSEAVIRIQVSAKDFESEEALALLSARLASPCEISVSTRLEPGDCTIALQLGSLEVGLGQQWGSLRAALDAMIDGDGR